jgi:hypothetical protein
MFTNDALQANLGFVMSQTSHIETQVYQIKYAEIQYPGLIPVDTSANPWATSVTYMSQDRAGSAAWQSGQARDVPFADVQHNINQTSVQMASIGYRYTLEEVMQARQISMDLPGDKARAARLASEEFVDRLALTGSTEKNYSGLFNYPTVPVVIAPNGASSSPLWSSKTTDEIIADLSAIIIGGFMATNTVAMADTVLIPWSRFLSISSKPRATGSDMSVMAWFRLNNPYTARTGVPLDIRGVRDLDTAGTSGAARVIAYRKSPDVLKLHFPMPLMFLPVQPVGLEYQVPGLFRLGGLDIRLPNEVRYYDGI